VLVPSRQTVVAAAVVLMGIAGVLPLACDTRARVISAGFWFDGVRYDASEAMIESLGGPITPAELRKGPRGGGRDRDKIVGHVNESDWYYAREIGLQLRQPDAKDAKAPVKPAAKPAPKPEPAAKS